MNVQNGASLVWTAINNPVKGEITKRRITPSLVTGGGIFVSVRIFRHIS